MQSEWENTALHEISLEDCSCIHMKGADMIFMVNEDYANGTERSQIN